MSKFLISGGKPLSGAIKVAGSKNAVLPMLAATLLTEKTCTIKNVPQIVDVENFLNILTGLGAEVKKEESVVTVTCRKIKTGAPDKKLVSSMRGSIVLMGALLGRTGHAELSHPGGDLIGARPVDVHLRGFRAMGAEISESNDLLVAQTSGLRGAEVFAESSVTGTENLILAAVLANGQTVIKLAAQEPHVVALCEFLVKMGAKISGIGTTTVVIDGAKKLSGAEAEVIPDMIEAGSFMILAAASKGHIEVQNIDHSHMDAVYNKFLEIGVNFEKKDGALEIFPPTHSYHSATIRTGLYPNLATDLQPPFGVLATQCQGTTIMHDWIFEGRLGYLAELKKMGANVKMIDTHRAEITGPTALSGSVIESLDIRSGMTLLTAALIASGDSLISGINHIDRGYENIDARLRGLGAEIKRIE